jgi:type I restriction enzyme S subunit
MTGTAYRTIGVRWWGEGAYERATIDGSETAAKTLSLVRRGDLIINKIWVRHGSVAVAAEDVDGCAASGEFPTFRPDEDRILPRWLHWICKTKGFWAACDDLSRGTSGKNRIRPERFLTIKIPLPPINEQRRIVARIEQLAGKLDSARNLREGASATTVRLLPTETTRLFEGLSYPTVALSSLGPDGANPIQTGPFGAQLHASDFVDAGVPVLNVGNVWPEGLRLANLDHVTEQNAATLTRYSLEPSDLLFARSGATLGKVCLVPDDCRGWLMTGHLFRVRLDQKRCDPRFVFAGLRSADSVRGQVFDLIRGATRPGFNTSLLSRVRIPLPPLAEQRRIVEHLERYQARVVALKTTQAHVAAELDALLPAVLDRAFRGEF